MNEAAYIVLALIFASLLVAPFKVKASMILLALMSLIFIALGVINYPLGLFMIAAGISWFLTSFYSFTHYNEKNLGVALAGTMLGIAIVLLSSSYLELLAGWETMTIFSYVGIGIYKKEWRPGFVFMAFGEVSTALLLAGFIIATSVSGSFYFTKLNSVIPFVLTTFGFFVKMGIFPFLVVEWLPIAHGSARSDLSAVLSATMTMAGVYGIFKMESLSPLSLTFGVVLVLIGAFSTLFGALYSYVSDHVKGMLAFSTVENNGAMLALLGSLELIQDPALKAFATFSLFVLVLAHSLSKTGLFISTGYLHGESMSTLKAHRDKIATFGLVLMTASLSGLLPTVGGIAVWSLLETLFMESITLPHLINLTPIVAGIMIGMGEGFATGALTRFASFTQLVWPEKVDHKWILASIGALTLVVVAIAYFISPFNTQVPQLAMFFNSVIASKYENNGFGGISPLYIIVALPLISLVVYSLSGKKRIRRVEAWDNGTEEGLRYTSFGMANNLRLMLKTILRTSMGSMETSADIFWRAMVFSITKYSAFSRLVSRTYMNSSLKWYVIYMIVAFIMIMLVVLL
ncbi:MAG: proton-conducting transporter membrane subunit [Metallosphaera sp.]|uniref:proton-conducting transporter transmembrane domain-containing protein n=1 Tax=Metallosphaera sp. TaxID=2020860 RepID=UPI003166C352